MDGTLVEYGVDEKPDILANKEGFYLNKLPINSMLNIAKELSKVAGVKVGVLSNCYYKEQKEDKLEWLRRFAPFMDERQRNIIVYNDLKFSKQEKDYLKVCKI